jgi:diguanylate cyclase (GGDEF)-like protein
MVWTGSPPDGRVCRQGAIVHRIAAAREAHGQSLATPDAEAHPTTSPATDPARRRDMHVWRLLDLLVEPVTPTLLHDIIRQVVTVTEADEVALFSCDATPLLLAAHGRRVFAEQAALTDRRLERASALGELIQLGDGDQPGGWRTDRGTVVQHGLWIPAPRGGDSRVVLRVLRVASRPFAPGTVDLLWLVTKRLTSVVAQRHDQQSTNLQHVERAQLFLVSSHVAQELDPGMVARRIARGLTAVTDFATATVELIQGAEVRRAAIDGDRTAAVGTVTPLRSWQAELTDERALGEVTYRMPPGDLLPSPSDGGAAGGLVTRLRDHHGDEVGFLTLSRPRTGAGPSSQIVQTIELFTHQAQLALANARLYDEATRQRDVAHSLTRLTRALSTSLDTDAVLDTCCEAALSLSAGSRASVFLIDEHDVVRHGVTRQAGPSDAADHDRADDVPDHDRQTAPSPDRDHAHDGPDHQTGGDQHDDRGTAVPPWPPRALRDCTLLAHVADADQPLLLDDLSRTPFADAAVVRALGPRAVAVYPLRVDGATLGLLVIDGHDEPVAWSADEVGPLSQIANQAAVALRQSKLHERTREQADRAARLLELTTAMTTTLHFAAIFRRIVQALEARLDAHAVAVLRIDERSMDVLGTMVDGTVSCPRPSMRLPIDQKLVDALALVRERETLRIADIRDCPTWSSIATPTTRAAILAAPVDRTGTDVLLTVSSTRAGAFTAADEQFLGDLARVTQLAVRNADLFDRVSESARRDPLTGLFNRRAFWTQLQGRLKHLQGTDTVALAVVDADDFKAINDRFGHAVGDAALQHIADQLRSTVRDHGDVFRIGGEEFTVVMPNATADQARRVLEHVSGRIRVRQGDLPALSVSAGVAVAPVNGRTADALFGEADRALLDAKARGKDRVELRRAVA